MHSAVFIDDIEKINASPANIYFFKAPIETSKH